MTPLEIIRKFWPSVRLSLDRRTGRLIIRDPNGRPDVVAWIAAHEKEIIRERMMERR